MRCAGHSTGEEITCSVVEHVPKQDSVKRGVRVPQVGFKETCGARGRSYIQGVLGRASSCFAQFSFLLRQKVLPCTEKVLGGNAEPALDEETQGGLPGRAKVQKRATAESVEVPQEFFQPVGNAVGFPKFRPSSCARCHGW